MGKWCHKFAGFWWIFRLPEAILQGTTTYIVVGPGGVVEEGTHVCFSRAWHYWGWVVLIVPVRRFPRNQVWERSINMHLLWQKVRTWPKANTSNKFTANLQPSKESTFCQKVFTNCLELSGIVWKHPKKLGIPRTSDTHLASRIAYQGAHGHGN